MELKLALLDLAILSTGAASEEYGHVGEGVSRLEVASVHALWVVLRLEDVAAEVDKGLRRERNSLNSVITHAVCGSQRGNAIRPAGAQNKMRDASTHHGGGRHSSSLRKLGDVLVVLLGNLALDLLCVLPRIYVCELVLNLHGDLGPCRGIIKDSHHGGPARLLGVGAGMLGHGSEEHRIGKELGGGRENLEHLQAEEQAHAQEDTGQALGTGTSNSRHRKHRFHLKGGQ